MDEQSSLWTTWEDLGDRGCVICYINFCDSKNMRQKFAKTCRVGGVFTPYMGGSNYGEGGSGGGIVEGGGVHSHTSNAMGSLYILRVF